MKITTSPPGRGLERELRDQIREWRQGRATKKLSEALSDAYVLIFAVVVIGAMLINVLLTAQVTASQCAEGSCLAARTLLPVATWAGVVAIAIAVARLFGPVVASTAEGFWLMDAPVDRGRLLTGRLAGVLAAATGIGAAAGALITLLTGTQPAGVIAWALASGLAAAALTAFAAAEQGAERTIFVRLAEVAFGLSALAAILLVVAIAADWVRLAIAPAVEVQLAFVIAAASLLVLIISAVLARARLTAIRRVRLTSGGALVKGLSGSLFALDFGLAHDILTEQRAKERGHVRPTRGRGQGPSALVWRDLQRLLRRPQVLIGPVVAVVVPYAAAALGLGTVASPLTAIALFWALVPMLGGLRVLSRSPGIARALPFAGSRIRVAQVLVPAVVAIVYAVATVPAYVGLGAGGRPLLEAVEVAVITAAAGLLAAVRWITAKPANYQAPAVASPIGSLPTGMIGNLVRGFEVAFLITIPLVFGLPMVISLLIAVITAIVLFGGGVNMEELQRQQAEQRRRMDAERR
ncbi:hypothetical protein GGQ54_001176 [Naumannella cuiyingiana]|uniref:Uncharacterized protein n=1 Tax=Naumannella cuiyingiana TaxID=1347891 RepID=A0A7Z0D800_9ACTN|nr:DUF6297 family protein [Naumannella cuiyingiana]NYI70616.1 hypothetical protein [Naumannella cuiyingiana]